MNKLMIGWAEESIVPDKKVDLAGQFFERISEYVESEITVTAMAVQSGEETMILVSADVISFASGSIELVRRKFAKLTDEIDPKNLIICATHTHTSVRMANLSSAKTKPVKTTEDILNEFLPEGKRYVPLVSADDSVMTKDEVIEFVSDKIALAAKRAWDNRAESYYTNEFGRAAVGMCRRVSYDDGSAQMWGDTNTANFVSLEGGNDSGVELLYTFNKDKKLVGIVANIACPAQILEQRSFISADYWGRTKANLREKFGEDIFLLALCGAAGDQCPRDLVRWVEPETPIDDPNIKRPHLLKRKADPSMYDIAGCNRVGKRIANEIVAVYEEIEELKSEAIFKHKIIHLDLPLRKVTIKERDEAIREIEYYVEKIKDKETLDFADIARIEVHAGVIQRFEEQQCTEVYPIEFHIIRLGDIAIATNPFELFLDYGNRIKARSYAEQTFIVQLCCGVADYLPTEKAEKAGHYSAYVTSGYVGHEGGDLLVRESIHHINEMWETE